MEKDYGLLENKYRYAAQQASVSLLTKASAVTRAIEDKVSSYAYSQCRASLDASRKTVSIPHPELGEMEIPHINRPFTNCQKVPVPGKDLILQEVYNDVNVILKRCPTLYHAASECHALSKVKGGPGIPHVIGIHHSYNESFVVTQCIPSDFEFISLQDAMYGEAFSLIKVSEWQNLLHKLWQAIDFLHSRGYIHNNLVAANVVISVQKDELVPYLSGFSLMCHIKDAIKIFPKHDQNFAKVIGHLHQDVYFGKVTPSFSSDIFCFGQLLGQLHRAFILLKEKTALPNEQGFWENIRLLASSCSGRLVSDIPYGQSLAPFVKKYLM